MRRTASIRVGELAQHCTDPEVAERQMRKAISWGIQVNKRTVRMIKLERLLRCSVGTGKVELLAERLATESRGGRILEEKERVKVVRQKVILLMSDKLKDAVADLELGRVQFNKSKKVLSNIVPAQSRLGQEVRIVMRREMSLEWQEKMDQMRRSVYFLINKHRASRREEVPASWRGIMISDQALGDNIQLPAPFLSERIGEVSDAAKDVLQLPPKTAVYSKISMKDIEREVLKAVNVKARWEDMGREEREGNQQTREEADEEERVETEVFNRQEGILRLHKMRVTSLPTNKEICLPDERPDEVEAGLQAFGSEVLEVARKYVKENVDKDGNVRKSNLSETQKAGLKDIEAMIKEKHIVTKTDKSDRLCLRRRLYQNRRASCDGGRG